MTGAIARRLTDIRERSAMSNAEVAEMLNSRPETVSRWNSDKSYPHPRTEKLLLELDFIIEQLAEFYDPKEARQFFFSRQKLLKGESPADLIKQGRIEEVHRLVNQIRDAAYL